ncbi:hypothetical protein ED733_008299 [Metarhizium rileyi]|uniref:Uncharacterized protein n=1 Tax=Metarhizium rileyi (strain RCEF 4871) TaxID=1649241 RepID=A0A5C6GNF8_METRR|nr:hypothetical protein ED733_008299 [Metarhizium rileyi]
MKYDGFSTRADGSWNREDVSENAGRSGDGSHMVRLHIQVCSTLFVPIILTLESYE